MVNSLMSQATYIDVPEEETYAGQFKSHLASYCTSHIRAMSPEEIEMGKPWTDDGVTKFKLEGLLEFLNHRRFNALTRAQIIQQIRDMGGDSGSQNITKRSGKRTKIRCWWIPAFEDDDIELPVKELDSDIPF